MPGTPPPSPELRSNVSQKTCVHEQTCSLKQAAVEFFMESIEDAWKRWEMAVRFEDTKQQDYYMQFIILYARLVKQVRKF